MTKNEKLMIAIEEGNFKKTMKLVKNGADVNYRNFKYSICKKNLPVKWLLIQIKILVVILH